MSKIVPNSTPTPNFYYDELEWLLTSDEWKVLSYAVRRILGFEKGRDSTSATISLSTFEAGVSIADQETGELILLAHGCGLSRPKISAALGVLVKFRIMRRGRSTKNGRVWKLETDDTKIDFDGLATRQAAAAEKGAERIAKAAKASADKRRKPDDSTVVVPPEEVRLSYQEEYDSPTSSGSAVVPIESNGKATGKQVLPNSPEKTPTPTYLMAKAIMDAHGYDEKHLTKKARDVCFGAAKELVEAAFFPDDIPAIYAYVKKRSKAQGWNGFTPMALAKYAPEWLAANPRPSNDPPAPLTTHQKLLAEISAHEREVYAQRERDSLAILGISA